MDIAKNKIVFVNVVGKYKSLYYKIKKEKKLFGITYQKYGIYDLFDNYYKINDAEILRNRVIIDNILYEKPCVYISTCDNRGYCVYFNTYSEALKYKNRLLSDIDSVSI